VAKSIWTTSFYVLLTLKCSSLDNPKVDLIVIQVSQNDLKSATNANTSSDVLATISGELYIKDAYKSFGVTKALNGVSFSANFGEIHAIVGGNGCGKSTLAKVISGVLALDTGQVSVLGQVPVSPATAKSIGILTVFQEVMIADQASVLDNLFVGSDGLWTKSLSHKQKYDKTKSLMKELTAEDIDPEMAAANLPLSTKAWITIGRALLCDPKVLILDESSAALDFDSTERLFDKMRELRDRGTAVLIVTHRIAELIRISDRATVMRDGKDVGVLEKKDITEKNLLALMTGHNRDDDEVANQAHHTESEQSVLRARNLNVWLESDSINFDLLRGEIIGITGLDGHGQEDFVSVMAGVQPASSGVPETWISNQNRFQTLKSLDEAKDHGVAFVSGDRKREGILPNLSIFENLLIPLYRTVSRGGRLQVVDWASLSPVFEREVERLSIKTGAKTNLITSLSGGNQQKVLIGRAFASNPDILILNDPARGIDVEAKTELYKHLREFASAGGSVIYMSSELEEFIGFCSRVLVFRNGSVFDEFVDDQVEPVGILEGMFGQSRGLGKKSASTSASKARSPQRANDQKPEKETLKKAPDPRIEGHSHAPQTPQSRLERTAPETPQKRNTAYFL
jgi:ribose transport system ATP-binding protein